MSFMSHYTRCILGGLARRHDGLSVNDLSAGANDRRAVYVARMKIYELEFSTSFAKISAVIIHWV